MGARAELAAALTPLLPETIKVIDHPRKLDSIEGSITAVVMITRTEIKPGNNAMGGYAQSFELVVIEPRTEPETSEDSLDDNTDAVIEILDKETWLIWTSCSRSTYDDRYPAYKFDIAASTKITKE